MTLALATVQAVHAAAALPPPGVLGLLHLHLHLFAHIQAWMHEAGYPVLFLLLFSCGVGLPLPEDVPLLFAGYFVATGEMSLVPAAVTAWLGIVGGDCILYSIGRRYGLAIQNVPVIGRHIRRDQIDRMHDHFERYGVWVVAVGRLFAGVRGAMVLVAGTIRFTFSHFIIADGLAAIFSGGIFLGLGYYAGKKFGDLNEIHHEIEKYSMRVLLGLAVVVVIAAVIVWWRKRRPEGAGPVTDGTVPRESAPPATVRAAADSPTLPPA